MKSLILILAVIILSSPSLADDCRGDAGTALVVGRVVQSKADGGKCLARISFHYFTNHALCPMLLRPTPLNWIYVLKDKCPQTADTESGILNAYSEGRWTLEDL